MDKKSGNVIFMPDIEYRSWVNRNKELLDDNTVEDWSFTDVAVDTKTKIVFNLDVDGVPQYTYSSNAGVNVIDFWVEGAEFMSIAGVPHIWYDTWDDNFRAYPCFLRMAIDCMEGLLDAYLLAEAHGLDKYSWYEAIEAFGKFLVRNQNEDGSYYRCYNYSGGPFENWDDGIEEPIGKTYGSTSPPAPRL